MSDAPKTIPRATYRLQFTKQFGFAQAADVAPYLAKLGISHVYASPYFKAHPGSLHGYDIVSHVALNPELGSQADFDAMVAAFRANNLSQVVDFVPNHMGIGGADNPWWLDVLEWGPQSEFAAWFDIDWHSGHDYLRGKVLVPFLGDQYGAVLEAGGLCLEFDAQHGSFAVWAHQSHKLPIHPGHYGRILGNAHPVLERLGDAFAHPADASQAHRLADDLKAELARQARSPAVGAALAQALARFRGRAGEADGWRRLDRLIRDQFWRAAHFRVAADDINYRRFFNINELAGIRMELPALFEHAHRLVFRLLEEGAIDGLRLDHIDGLLDPKAYCLSLRERAPRPFYLLVEKILASHENLRDDWNVDGTTGYEFANLVTGLLIDPAGEATLDGFYAAFTGRTSRFDDIVRASKAQIMEHEMAGELSALARKAGRLARANPRTADFTDHALRRALQQIIACFPVYRTYVDAARTTEADRREIDEAVARARDGDALHDRGVFDFLRAIMTGDLVAGPRSGYSRKAVLHLAMAIQQYSGPVMAKGLEDTAFYRYNRMLALNEVGGHPGQFCVSTASFHAVNAARARAAPHAMLATSTHDTKRGEDARARLAVLSELAGDWVEQVTLWSSLLRHRETPGGGGILFDRNDEYLFYQLLLGAWPAELLLDAAPDRPSLAPFCSRVEAAMLKSVREAKTHTAWTAVNPAYEQAVLAFVRHALDPLRSGAFLASFSAFATRVARLAVQNSLVQTALKLTVPGVPDIYQGSELWNFSMVDPDNRRPVDFDANFALLRELPEMKAAASLLDGWPDGRIKLHLIARLLELRRAMPDLFEHGDYTPLTVTGRDAARVCAFSRQAGGAAMAVAVSLFPSRDLAGRGWGDTAVSLPDAGPGWASLFDGGDIVASRQVLGAADLFRTLPVAVLRRGSSRTPSTNR
jgi:(1->4)-alpha-D-glucan 1-alpha-D-glucosylmutase